MVEIFGLDFEQYLLKLNEPDTILGLQNELYGLRNVDGRLIVDPSQTKLYTDTKESQSLIIQTMLNIQGLPQISVSGSIEDFEEYSIPTVQEFIGQPQSPWIDPTNNGDTL